MCDDDWDMNDASVVCRELGFPKALTATKPAVFGTGGNGTIWTNNVRCAGNETSLTQCAHNGWEKGTCHSKYAEAACSPGKTNIFTQSCRSMNPSKFLVIMIIHRSVVLTRTGV